MQINIRALFILMLCMTGATALILWKVLSSVLVDTKIIVISVSGALVFMGLLSLLYYKLGVQPILRSRRLQKNGIPGAALITAVKDTGASFSENPHIELVLEVKNGFGEAYHTSLLTVVSRINAFKFQPGMTLPVKIDPKNKMLVAIDEQNLL